MAPDRVPCTKRFPDTRASESKVRLLVLPVVMVCTVIVLEVIFAADKSPPINKLEFRFVSTGEEKFRADPKRILAPV
jgi:hypothetical protein